MPLTLLRVGGWFDARSPPPDARDGAQLVIAAYEAGLVSPATRPDA